MQAGSGGDGYTGDWCCSGCGVSRTTTLMSVHGSPICVPCQMTNVSLQNELLVFKEGTNAHLHGYKSPKLAPICIGPSFLYRTGLTDDVGPV